jgi:hypothetical protein
MTMVSSANNDGSDIEFILRQRSFIYLMNIEALDLFLGALHVSVYSSQRKKVLVV